MPLGGFSLPILQTLPSPSTSNISPSDHERLVLTHQLHRDSKDRTVLENGVDLQLMLPLYEEMMERYPESPFFTAETGNMLVVSGVEALGVRYWRTAQETLRKLGLSDDTLNVLIAEYNVETEKEAFDVLTRSQQRFYYQPWKSTRQFRFPYGVSELPTGHAEVKERWEKLRLAEPLSDSESRKGLNLVTTQMEYLRRSLIETIQIESVLRLTDESAIDIVRRGVEDGLVDTLPDSPETDPKKIRDILNDTLSCFDLIEPLQQTPTPPTSLTPSYICMIHSKLMNTCRFPAKHNNSHYVPPGQTRTVTCKTVFISGVRPGPIQCCPFPDVDRELEVICDVVKPHLTNTEDNPFAVASWIHNILGRCHPFEDGNGRLTRLIASIPLLVQGYPPISISSSQRAEYLSALNKAYDGDHGPLMQCILEGMRQTLELVV